MSAILKVRDSEPQKGSGEGRGEAARMLLTL